MDIYSTLSRKKIKIAFRKSAESDFRGKKEWGAFYTDEDGKPFCLDCSLKAAEKDLEAAKTEMKGTIKNGIISSIVWLVGICLYMPTKSMGLSFFNAMCCYFLS